MSQRTPGSPSQPARGLRARKLWAGASVLLAASFALGVVYVSSRDGGAQRLCENSDSAVAKISPCTGPPGTVINVTLRRQLASPPATLFFKRVLTNGVPAQVRVPVNGLAAPSPRQLCTTGGGKWEVWLVDAAGTSQGVIGVFWPDCRGITNVNANTNGNVNGNSNGNGGNGNSGNVNANSKNGNANVDEPGGPIDPCLVGTWEATSVVPASSYITGGGTGFRVTFNRDGTETVDYSAMQPFQAGNDETTYTGSATAHISTANKTARVESVERVGVSLILSRQAGGPGVKLPGLGFGGLGDTSGDNSYTCTKDTLEYQGSMRPDKRPNVSIKLTRRRG